MRSTTSQRLRANSALNGLASTSGPREILYGTERITGNVMTADEVRQYLHRSFDFTPKKASLVRRLINWIGAL